MDWYFIQWDDSFVFLSEVAPSPRNTSFGTATAAPNNAATTASDNRWISSLRRRDPEIQPTLPSIVNHSSSSSSTMTTGSSGISFTTPLEKRGRSSAIKSALRKSRSVERMRARKISSKIKERGPKKSSSEEGVSDDQEATSIEENTNCTVSPKQQSSPTKRLSSDKHHGQSK